MARTVAVVLEDDLDGGPADETVRFAFDGTQYEIDLSAKNARAFRQQLTPFIEHARKPSRRSARRNARTAAGRQRSAEVRAWAKDHGIAVSARGRIPASVMEQYQAAHPATASGAGFPPVMGWEAAGFIPAPPWVHAGDIPDLVPLGGDYWTGTRYPLTSADHVLTAPGASTDPADVVQVGPFEITARYLSLSFGGQSSTLRALILPASSSLAPGARRKTTLIGPTRWIDPGLHVSATGPVLTPVTWDLGAFIGGRVLLLISSPGSAIIADEDRLLVPSGAAPVLSRQPVWGFADLHSHPAAFLGFGGHLISGATAADSADPADLGTCDLDHSLGPFDFIVNMWPDGHQAGGRDGAPGFRTWPTFMEGLHQQMHPAWIKRAWQGGLRLMVALVVNSETLADQRPFDDMPHDDFSIIPAQVQFMLDVAAANSAWMGIARTPAEARTLIQSGKLAVVLGLEVDSFLGKWLELDEITGIPNAGLRSPEQVRQVLRDRLQELYDLGIRQLNPVHLANNPFGGCSIYENNFNINNFHLHHDCFSVEAADPDVDFRLGNPDWFMSQFIASTERGWAPPDYDAVFPGNGHRNVWGVNPVIAGPALDLMREIGFVIDVDHMSDHTTAWVLDQCTAVPSGSPGARPRYPVVSAHDNFRALAPRRHWRDEGNPPPGCRADPGVWPHESMKSESVARRIAGLDGMFAPITSAKDCLDDPGSPVTNSCPGSSRTYAQTFHHAVGYSPGRGVGIGTDMCLNPQLGPRYGPLAVYGLADERSPGVATERYSKAWAQGTPTPDGVVYATPVQSPPRFFNPPNLDATGRLNPLVVPQDSLIDTGIGDRYAFSVDIWKALWYHEAGRDPLDGESGRMRDMLRGFSTPIDAINSLGGVARTACEVLNGSVQRWRIFTTQGTWATSEAISISFWTP
jgi:microsomal dipeptidase-like Zn-dependent dipeptidase